MKMDENTRKIGIFSVLGLVWIASILFIMAPDLGLARAQKSWVA
jgi:hypothetical protein